MSTKTKIKQLITAYLNFKEVYEAGLTEKQLTKVRNIMYDFSSFIDETTVNEFDTDDDDEDYIDEDKDPLTVEDNSLYILNDDTGEMEQYDWNYIDNINEEQNSNPDTNNNEYTGDEFDYQYDKAKQYKHN